MLSTDIYGASLCTVCTALRCVSARCFTLCLTEISPAFCFLPVTAGGELSMAGHVRPMEPALCFSLKNSDPLVSKKRRKLGNLWKSPVFLLHMASFNGKKHQTQLGTGIEARMKPDGLLNSRPMSCKIMVTFPNGQSPKKHGFC